MSQSVRFLHRHEAAEFLGITVSRLAQLNSIGKGPRYHRPVGVRSVRYKESDLIEWLGDPIGSPAEAAARDRAMSAA